MKLIRCIKKNLKVLARSKGSALVVLLAPLIIVFIIGLGFMEDPDVKLNIGIHTAEPSNLTNRYIESFNTTQHNIIMYDNKEDCMNSISEGNTVMCAIFSENFELKDDAKNELTFYVDESRMNLVDKLISSFSTTLGTETSEISEELAQELLRIIDKTHDDTTKSLALTINNRAQTNIIKQETKTTKDSMDGIDTTVETINTRTLENKARDIEDDFSELRRKARDIIRLAEGINFQGENETKLEEEIEKLDEIIDESNALSNLDDLQDSLSTISSRITRMTDRLESVGEAKEEITTNINKIQTAITTLDENTEKIKTKKEEIIHAIESFELRTARTITNPVNTETKSVATEESRLTYSFSYLLTLAILFIGIMLSSTLVYMEKDSKAFFRNFTTPTTQKYFTLINYLTSLIIITLQTIIILIIAYYTLNVPILNNALITATILLLGITFFIVLGILIGLLATTSEAVTMSTIVIGSIFLFLSNLILPLETLSPIISQIANYNPYVIVSEGIRKAMLFDITIQQAQTELILLSIYTIIITIIMILVNNLGIKHYLATRRHRKNLIITQPENLTLELKGHKKKIKNIPELIKELKEIKQDEYQELIKDENPISEWLRNNLEKKMLARRIRKKKLKDTIKILEKHQEKQNKKRK